MSNYRNELKGFFTEYWKYMAVHTACKLDIFDLIQQNFNRFLVKSLLSRKV